MAIRSSVRRRSFQLLSFRLADADDHPWINEGHGPLLGQRGQFWKRGFEIALDEWLGQWLLAQLFHCASPPFVVARNQISSRVSGSRPGLSGMVGTSLPFGP